MTETMPSQTKKILIVTAHPEPQSLNATLSAFAATELRSLGHEVRTSDLYAMRWKATVDSTDFLDHPSGSRLHVLMASARATLTGRLAPDIAAEQEKVRWSDAVILQFPLWWFSVPAILKGWIDRVFTDEFAHGPSLPPPYSEGALAGRRALVSVTLGASETSFSDRGIHGRLSDILYPLQHGLFWFTGISPLEPFAVYDANELPEDHVNAAKRRYALRLARLFSEEPIAFRTLTGGDYDHSMRLLPDVVDQGARGLDIHLRPRG